MSCMRTQHCREHIRLTLLLMRNVRMTAIANNIDPDAMRIALKVALMIDTHISKRIGLTQKQDARLTKIAEKLFRETIENLKKAERVAYRA